MQMLSSTVPCPRCGSDAMITLFGPTGSDASFAELELSCPAGHAVPTDVSRGDLLEVWNDAHRRLPTSKAS